MPFVECTTVADLVNEICIEFLAVYLGYRCINNRIVALPVLYQFDHDIGLTFLTLLLY